ncbi:MerR family transcriptional regulator [Nocardioides bruguierae]|uniref:MerR family transcriptional regulator n=1 Tax=Nocardioides bruguierae TaxID=2945102 RepID=A0A9X2DAZ6_9ACTN|nr:MerR family transcriptional regulator [Nocardioides bruguierae]MCM0621299.1 MerR family transcriptional regulator [Nocardioides bruguierae]
MPVPVTASHAVPATGPTGLPIAEAATRSGLTADTLRYYEKDGLMLRPVPRTATGQRRYQPEDLRWIALVTRLRATGMPVRDVRRYADLVRAGDGNEHARLALLREHRQVVLAQLAEVTEHLGAIDAKIGIYEDRLAGVADLSPTRS